MMRRLILPVLITLCAASIWAAGPQSLGKIALLLGQPSVAADLLEEPGARGVALYRAGRYEEADAAFEEAGRSVTYNRGLSLAATGNYKLSVAYFNAVLFARPEDKEAEENRDAVGALLTPIIGDGRGTGRIAALAARRKKHPEDAVLPALANQYKVRRKTRARSTIASNEWLETLSDEPGEYLKKRLEAEYDRRKGLGQVVREWGVGW
jgi:Ca-activated chloride channel family protein